MSLDEAQRAKLDLVCRKLQLRPGDTVVEAGCGWGALALHMARHYGVHVKAFNVSREQLAFARERAAREGLSDRVEFIDDDYRNVRGTFDAFVSIGMLEHVGCRHFRRFADVLRRSLRRDGGRGLLHFIGRDAPRPLNAWIRRRIFPGAYTPTLAEVTTRVLAPAGMSVIDVENLRLHYARTLAHWGERASTRRRRSVRQHATATSSRAPGSCISRDRRPPSRPAGCSSSRCVFAPRESAPPFWTRADLFGRRDGRPDDSLRRARRRWRARRLDVRARAPSRRLERRRRRSRARSRATRSARGGSRRASSRCSTSIPATTAPPGLTLQEITAFRTGVIGDAGSIETRYPHVVSYAIRRCEFDDFLLRRAGVRVLEGTAVTTLRQERRRLDRQRRHRDTGRHRRRRTLLSRRQAPARRARTRRRRSSRRKRSFGWTIGTRASTDAAARVVLLP